MLKQKQQLKYPLNAPGHHLTKAANLLASFAQWWKNGSVAPRRDFLGYFYCACSPTCRLYYWLDLKLGTSRTLTDTHSSYPRSLLKTTSPSPAQPVKIDLDKKLDPKQKNIQTCNIDAQGFKKTRNENPPTWEIGIIS